MTDVVAYVGDRKKGHCVENETCFFSVKAFECCFSWKFHKKLTS